MKPAFRSLAVSLALCAMVLRAFLPEGWMPAAGAATLTICSVDITAPGSKVPDAPAQQRTHAPCAFSAATPFTPPSFVAAAGAIGEAVQIAAVFADDDFIYAPRYSPHTARAPPALS